MPNKDAVYVSKPTYINASPLNVMDGRVEARKYYTQHRTFRKYPVNKARGK
jgi:hypothetical protein